MRTDVYAKSAPVTSALCAALEKLTVSAKRSPQPELIPELNLRAEVFEASEDGAKRSPVSQATKTSSALTSSQNAAQGDQNDIDSQRAASQALAEQPIPSSGLATAQLDRREGPGSEASSQVGMDRDPVCRVCLGVMQSLDGPLQPVPEEVLPQLSERDGGGAPWSPVMAGDVASMAQHIRCAKLLAPVIYYPVFIMTTPQKSRQPYSKDLWSS